MTKKHDPLAHPVYVTDEEAEELFEIASTMLDRVSLLRSQEAQDLYTVVKGLSSALLKARKELARLSPPPPSPQGGVWRGLTVEILDILTKDSGPLSESQIAGGVQKRYEPFSGANPLTFGDVLGTLEALQKRGKVSKLGLDKWLASPSAHDRPKRRTREEVLKARNTARGCCDAFVDRSGCRCLEEAEDAPGGKDGPPHDTVDALDTAVLACMRQGYDWTPGKLLSYVLTWDGCRKATREHVEESLERLARRGRVKKLETPYRLMAPEAGGEN